MPKYKVTTDKGTFQVELDKEPESEAQLNEMVELHLQGQTADQFNERAKAELNAPRQDPLKQAQQGAVQEASTFNRSMLRHAIPVAATAATFAIPGGALATGGRIAAEGLLGGGGELLGQAVGGEDVDPLQIGMAAGVPAVGRAALGITKGVARGAASLMNPQQMRVAGMELLEDVFKGPQSKLLYAQARKAGPVPTQRVAQTTEAAFLKEANMSSPDNTSLEILSNLHKKLAGNTQLDYRDLMDEVHRLNTHATAAFTSGNDVTGMAVSDIAKEVLDQLDKVSPTIKAANAAYRREHNITKLLDATSKGNPAQEIRKLRRHDKLFADGFNDGEVNEMVDLVDRIGRTSPGVALGAGRVVMQAGAEVFAEGLANPMGRAFLKKLLQGPGFGAQSMAVFAQFMRGVSALPSAETIEATQAQLQSMDVPTEEKIKAAMVGSKIGGMADIAEASRGAGMSPSTMDSIAKKALDIGDKIKGAFKTPISDLLGR